MNAGNDVRFNFVLSYGSSLSAPIAMSGGAIQRGSRQRLNTSETCSGEEKGPLTQVPVPPIVRKIRPSHAWTIDVRSPRGRAGDPLKTSREGLLVAFGAWPRHRAGSEFRASCPRWSTRHRAISTLGPSICLMASAAARVLKSVA